LGHLLSLPFAFYIDSKQPAVSTRSTPYIDSKQPLFLPEACDLQAIVTEATYRCKELEPALWPFVFHIFQVSQMPMSPGAPNVFLSLETTAGSLSPQTLAGLYRPSAFGGAEIGER
jgi:hypothetical protein